jgi:hypothetical protein
MKLEWGHGWDIRQSYCICFEKKRDFGAAGENGKELSDDLDGGWNNLNEGWKWAFPASIVSGNGGVCELP